MPSVGMQRTPCTKSLSIVLLFDHATAVDELRRCLDSVVSQLTLDSELVVISRDPKEKLEESVELADLLKRYWERNPQVQLRYLSTSRTSNTASTSLTSSTASTSRISSTSTDNETLEREKLLGLFAQLKGHYVLLLEPYAWLRQDFLSEALELVQKSQIDLILSGFELKIQGSDLCVVSRISQEESCVISNIAKKNATPQLAALLRAGQLLPTTAKLIRKECLLGTKESLLNSCEQADELHTSDGAFIYSSDGAPASSSQQTHASLEQLLFVQALKSVRSCAVIAGCACFLSRKLQVSDFEIDLVEELDAELLQLMAIFESWNRADDKELMAAVEQHYLQQVRAYVDVLSCHSKDLPIDARLQKLSELVLAETTQEIASRAQAHSAYDRVDLAALCSRMPFLMYVQARCHHAVKKLLKRQPHHTIIM